MGEHLVSVIMPVYNGERYLGQAIESVQAQTYRPIELIVIDDGSLDSSAEIAKSFVSVRYASQEHAGIGAALNHGLQLAKGGYLAFLDSDDVWMADKTVRQIAALEQDPGLDAVFGHTEQFISPDVTVPPVRVGRFRSYIKGAMLIRRDSFLRVGEYDTRWKIGDFIEWYSRAVEKGLKSLMLPEIVLRRRIHEENTGKREREHQRDYVRILKQSLDRRRKGKVD